MEALAQDLRYTLRQLWAARGFTALAVLTLALGIGASTALFTVVESVLLRPLPYAHADRLMFLSPRADSPAFGATSWLDYQDVRDQSRTLEDVAAYLPNVSAVEIAGQPASLVSVAVTQNFFQTLGAKPLLGRTFNAAEAAQNGPGAAVLTESVWRSRFHADPGVLGRVIKIGPKPSTIVGVMPDWVRFPENGSSEMKDGMWTPLQPTGIMLTGRGWQFLDVIGKLRRGVTLAQAQSELDGISARIRKLDPDSTDETSLRAMRYQHLLTGPVRPAFNALLGAVGLVLLIACANVANLLIARFLGRRQEFAVRAALGAGRQRLVRQLLTEGALLSVAGCAGGLVLAAALMTLVAKLPDGTIPRSHAVGMDWTVLLALALIASATTVLSSLVPALLAARTEPQAVLQAASRGLGARAGGGALSRWLVVGEVALASLLLVGTGLLVHTLWNLEHAPLGFDASHVTTFDSMPGDSSGISAMSAAPAPASAPASVALTTYEPLLARMRAEPGIANAAFVTMRPLSGFNFDTSFTIVGAPKTAEDPGAVMTAVSPGYTETMGIRIVRGRTIQPGDIAGAPPVLVINQALADKYFPGKDPLGRQIDLGGKDTGMLQPFTVVGVLADQLDQQVGAPARPLLSLPYAQVPPSSLYYQGLLRTMVSFVVKTRGEVPVAAEMRAAFRQAAPGYSLDDFKTMDESIEKSIFAQRLSLYLTGSFAGLAILMVVAGVYGILAQLVGYRRHEIGIRMALGADRQGVARMILREGAVLVAWGLGAGALAAFGLGRLVKSFLYGVTPFDALSYLVALALLLLVGLAASVLPAWRAASIEPMEALRSE